MMTGKMATENGHRPRTFPTMTAKIVDVAIVVTLPKLHSTHSGVFRPLSSMTCMTELSERYGISSPSFLSEVIHYPHNAVPVANLHSI